MDGWNTTIDCSGKIKGIDSSIQAIAKGHQKKAFLR
jgi:hypothetical protein